MSADITDREWVRHTRQCEHIRQQAEANSTSIRRLSWVVLIVALALLIHVIGHIIQEVL